MNARRPVPVRDGAVRGHVGRASVRSGAGMVKDEAIRRPRGRKDRTGVAAVPVGRDSDATKVPARPVKGLRTAGRDG